MKEIALVLSSGGARGLAHIGVIEELESHGYKIKSVAGTSMGALVGGMYAAGKLDEVKDWIISLSNRQKVSYIDLALSFSHLVKGDKIIKAFKKIVPDVNIEDLPVPYCAVATDFATGKEVVFNKGSLYEAIRASISIPLFFRPICTDNSVLVDGGIVNPLPLNRVLRTEGDILVSSNVNGGFSGSFVDGNNSPHNPNYIWLAKKTVMLMIHQNSVLTSQIYRPDISIDIPSDCFGGFEYDKVEEIIEYGRLACRTKIGG